MKRWSGQLYPLALLGLLAALSFWLERAADLPEGRHDGKQRHDPDTYVENFVVRRLDTTGVLKYRLTAPYMEHYADDDSSLLHDPTLVSYRPDAPTMTLKGKNAYVTAQGEVVLFWNDVVATRAGTTERQAMVAHMPDLTVRPDDGIGFTGSPVEITEGRSWVKGVGMNMDNNESTLVLQSRVKGIYYKPTSPQ